MARKNALNIPENPADIFMTPPAPAQEPAHDQRGQDSSKFAPAAKNLRNQRLQILVTAELKKKLNDTAKAHGLSVNELIFRAIESFLDE